MVFFVFIIEEIQRERKGVHKLGCRCYKRLKVKTEGYGLIGGKGDLMLGTRRRLERFESVKGDCENPPFFGVYFKLQKKKLDPVTRVDTS
jgi:hypothetical protein